MLDLKKWLDEPERADNVAQAQVQGQLSTFYDVIRDLAANFKHPDVHAGNVHKSMLDKAINLRQHIEAALSDVATAMNQEISGDRPRWLTFSDRPIDYADILLAMGHDWHNLTIPNPRPAPPHPLLVKKEKR